MRNGECFLSFSSGTRAFVVKQLKAADPGHVLLDLEVAALDPLLQVLGHVMERSARQKAVFPDCCDHEVVRSLQP